jgi:hypothetical protein
MMTLLGQLRPPCTQLDYIPPPPQPSLIGMSGFTSEYISLQEMNWNYQYPSCGYYGPYLACGGWEVRHYYNSIIMRKETRMLKAYQMHTTSWAKHYKYLSYYTYVRTYMSKNRAASCLL